MSTKFYFVRRGRTFENLPEEVRGKSEEGVSSELTTEGRLQADMVAQALADVKFDCIYASPYYGAVQTAILISDHLDPELEIKIDDRIIKRGAGSHRIAIPRSQMMWDYNFAGTHSYEGEETLEQIESRISSFISDVLPRHAGKNILIVSHGGVARVFYAVMHGRPKSGNLLDFPYMRYGEYMEYEYKLPIYV